MIPRALPPFAPTRPRPLCRTALLCATPLLVTALAGCSVDETVTPLGAGATTTTTATESTSSTTPSTTSAPEPGPLKRTVSVQSPLAGPANNLLFDGDFDLSSAPGSGQYGWRMFNGAGTSEIPLTVETGGLCRTGLTCAKLKGEVLLLGRGTAAPADKGHVMSLWAKIPEEVPCSKIQVYALECDGINVVKIAAPDKQRKDGWCHYHAGFGPSQVSICMYIQTNLNSDVEALLDSGVLGPNDGTVPLKATADDPVDPATLARLANVQDYLRRTTRFGRPLPPSLPPSRE